MVELYCQFASVETEERNRIFLVESKFPNLCKIGCIYEAYSESKYRFAVKKIE